MNPNIHSFLIYSLSPSPPVYRLHPINFNELKSKIDQDIDEIIKLNDNVAGEEPILTDKTEEFNVIGDIAINRPSSPLTRPGTTSSERAPSPLSTNKPVTWRTVYKKV